MLNNNQTVKNESNIGSRVIIDEFGGGGPFTVKSLSTDSADCKQEFGPLCLKYPISQLKLHPIQKADIGFMVNTNSDDYTELCYSNHFKNNSSANVVLDFFYAIICRTIDYFKMHSYRFEEIRTFKENIRMLLTLSEEELAIQFDNFFFSQPDYNNVYIILYSASEELLDISCCVRGDFFLQWTIILITKELLDYIDKSKALEAMDLAFRLKYD